MSGDTIIAGLNKRTLENLGIKKHFFARLFNVVEPCPWAFNIRTKIGKDFDLKDEEGKIVVVEYCCGFEHGCCLYKITLLDGRFFEEYIQHKIVLTNDGFRILFIGLRTNGGSFDKNYMWNMREISEMEQKVRRSYALESTLTG
jgi:hypothetical protein